MKPLVLKILAETLRQIPQLLFSRDGRLLVLPVIGTVYAQVTGLLHIQYSLAIVLILMALCIVLTYIRVKNIYKPKEPKIIKQTKILVDSYEWIAYKFSNGRIDIAKYPYCIKHKKKYIDYGVYYGCPTPDFTCTSIFSGDFSISQQQALSIAESELNNI